MSNREVSQARLILRPYTKSLNFDGTDDFATVPITPSLTGFNISFWWYNHGKTTNNDLLVDWSDSINVNGFYILRNSNANTVNFVIKDAIGAMSAGVVSVRSTSWMHIVGSYYSGNVNIYVNSVKKTGTIPRSMGSPTGQTLTIGKRSNSAAYVKELINEFCFQNTTTPWTQAQVDDLYFRGIYPTGASFYSLDGNVLDQDGLNGLTLTGTNYVENRPC